MTLLIVLGNFSATPIIAGGSQMLHHLGSQAHKHNEIFNEAVIILDAMKSSPSCNRVAATRLVESCQSFGGKHTDDAQADEHEALDSIRSMYAARLAICELDGAGASVPALILCPFAVRARGASADDISLYPLIPMPFSQPLPSADVL